jgi:Amt family ammonium transporter
MLDSHTRLGKLQTLILWIMHFIPGLRLRCGQETEIIGVDDAEMGEFAYDYVGIENEIGHNPHEELNALNGGREPQHKATHDSSEAEKAAST